MALVRWREHRFPPRRRLTSVVGLIFSSPRWSTTLFWSTPSPENRFCAKDDGYWFQDMKQTISSLLPWLLKVKNALVATGSWSVTCYAFTQKCPCLGNAVENNILFLSPVLIPDFLDLVVIGHEHGDRSHRGSVWGHGTRHTPPGSSHTACKPALSVRVFTGAVKFTWKKVPRPNFLSSLSVFSVGWKPLFHHMPAYVTS
jgi:hypothetical protein